MVVGLIPKWWGFADNFFAGFFVLIILIATVEGGAKEEVAL